MNSTKRVNLALQGWSQGGGPGARAALRAFWSELGAMSVDICARFL